MAEVLVAAKHEGERPLPHDIEVFFDGACPLCRREVDMLRRRDRGDRILFVDIAAEDFDSSDLGVDLDQLMERIHARLPDGRMIQGVEVFRRLYTLVGFPRLVWVSRLPVVAPLLDLAYALFARHRLRLTGRCAPKTCRVEGVHKSTAKI